MSLSITIFPESLSALPLVSLVLGLSNHLPTRDFAFGWERVGGALGVSVELRDWEWEGTMRLVSASREAE